MAAVLESPEKNDRWEPLASVGVSPREPETTTENRRARRLAVAGTLTGIVAIAIAIWCWQWSGGIPTDVPLQDMGQQPTLTVRVQPISADLNILGIIAPARSITVAAPFDGVISEKRAQIGDTVKVGDILLTLDASDITSQYRTAQSAVLKAQMAVQSMQRWESSSDVMRAKRILEASEASLATLDRQIQEVKGLFDQGIVSRNEYEGIVQQRDTQQVQVESNRQDLQAILDRGDADNRQLLNLDLQNAADKLNELKQKLSGAAIAAAISGVLTRPPADKSNDKVPVAPSGRVAQGTPLFAIADTTSFIAVGTVDEVDVNRIRVGQPVTISSDAVSGAGLTGRIVAVSSEATQQVFGQTPSFEVRVSFSPQTEAQRRAIKLGMSAKMSVQVYTNPSAIVIPPAAISNDAAGAKIAVLRNGKIEVVSVSLGETFPAGVEIVSGLEPGQQILINGIPDSMKP